MRDRPTVVLVHGGPGGYDHSYFKPDFGRLTTVAQVVYLDLRDHGRSARHDPAWTFEACADDVRAFCDAVGIARPIVLGHSMGGFIAMLYGARHPGHAGGLVLQSTWALRPGSPGGGLPRDRRRRGGRAGPARLRRRPGERRGLGPGLRRVRAAHPGCRPARAADGEPGRERARHGPACRRSTPSTSSPGSTAPRWSPSATSTRSPRRCGPGDRGRARAGIGRLAVIDGAGHFPWLDVPDRYWPVIQAFVTDVG